LIRRYFGQKRYYDDYRYQAPQQEDGAGKGFLGALFKKK
jgi:hypothetical protein